MKGGRYNANLCDVRLFVSFIHSSYKGAYYETRHRVAYCLTYNPHHSYRTYPGTCPGTDRSTYRGTDRSTDRSTYNQGANAPTYPSANSANAPPNSANSYADAPPNL